MIPASERVFEWSKELRRIESQLNLVNHDMQAASEAMTSQEIMAEDTNQVYTEINRALDDIVNALMHLSDAVRYTGALAFDVEQHERR